MPERKNFYEGSISYDRLWETMERRGVKQKALTEEFNISPTLIRRLKNNENVSLDTIMYLCYRLNCEPYDIVEYKR